MPVSAIPVCYHVVLDKLTWSAAAERCISLHPDAHLVSINNAAEQTAVVGLLSQYPGAVDGTIRYKTIFALKSRGLITKKS